MGQNLTLKHLRYPLVIKLLSVEGFNLPMIKFVLLKLDKNLL